jgi:hypothetical protein
MDDFGSNLGSNVLIIGMIMVVASLMIFFVHTKLGKGGMILGAILMVAGIAISIAFY